MKATQLLLVLAALVTSLQAGVVPGRWDKVDTLDLPAEVIVILKVGTRVEGSLVERTAGSLEMQASRPDALFLKRSTIWRVMKAERTPDSTRNGTLIGTGVGFGIGFGTMVAVDLPLWVMPSRASFFF